MAQVSVHERIVSQPAGCERTDHGSEAGWGACMCVLRRIRNWFVSGCWMGTHKRSRGGGMGGLHQCQGAWRLCCTNLQAHALNTYWMYTKKRSRRGGMGGLAPMSRRMVALLHKFPGACSEHFGSWESSPRPVMIDPRIQCKTARSDLSHSRRSGNTMLVRETVHKCAKIVCGKIWAGLNHSWTF